MEAGERNDHRLHELVEISERLGQLGAGYEAARILAGIVEHHDPSEASERALDILQQWDLSIEAVRTRSPGRIQSLVKSLSHRSHHQELTLLHLENLVRLEQFPRSADLLLGHIKASTENAAQPAIQEWMRSKRLENNGDAIWTRASLTSALRKWHETRTLAQRIRFLRMIDHELSELVYRAWQHTLNRAFLEDVGGEHDLPPLDEILSALRERLPTIESRETDAIDTITQVLGALGEHSRQAQQLLEQLPPGTPTERESLGLRKPTDEDPGRSMFHPIRVRHYQIRLTKEAIEELREEPKQYVRGTFIAGHQQFKSVGIRLKGSWGSFRQLDDLSKTAFTIKFNQFEKGRRFNGLRRIVLNNAVQDPSYLREALGYDIFRDAGIPAPRITYATLAVNGQRKGLYVQVEAVTKDHLKRWYKKTNGNLYEGPGDVTDWRDLDLDSNRDREDRSDLRALTRAIKEADDRDPWAGLSLRVDYEHFLRFLATEQILNHWDGYTSINNYRLYRNPDSDRFEFLPHGGDQFFENPFEPIIRPQRGILGRAVVRTEKGKRDFIRTVRQLLDSVWDEALIRQRITAYYHLIRPHLVHRDTPHLLLEFEETVRHVLDFISIRGTAIRFQLRPQEKSASWRVPHHHDEELHELLEGEWGEWE